ncbi:metalloendopeptidase [Flammeovirgaceae bacterium 311]|nr:metalloendopeptidase [Flammeovirgaceae bacterium 311]
MAGACATQPATDQTTATAEPEPVVTETTLPEGVGINLSYMDTTVSPGEDFFRYVNGNWIDQTEIPGDQGRWGSFQELRERNNNTVLRVLQTAAASNQYAEGSAERKAAEFYRIGMDSARAEQQGIQPLMPMLERVQALKSKQSLQEFLAYEDRRGGDVFYGFGVFPDLKNSKVMAAYLGAGGIGLPDRDYYVKDDAKSKEIRQEYQKHIARMFEMMGQTNAGKKAETVLAMETRLAQNMLTKEEQRNPYNLYHKRSIDQLNKMTPSVNWTKYLADLGAPKLDSLIVMQPKYMEAYEKMVKDRSLDDLKTYLSWRLIDDAASFLSHQLVEANFDFYSKYLRDVQEMSPRWKRVIGTADNMVGEAIGKLYVDETFPPEAKEKAQEMVDNIKAAFGDRIRNLEWMSDSTKQKALQKLGTFTVKIGYPDEWRDYSGLQVNAGNDASYLSNVIAGNEFNFQRELDKLGKPVDRTEWGMTPQTVNAYYNPLFNEIVFPAGILQPPFYDYRADAAVNYGGIGAVIGHEISHGFDDQGSRFDAEGNLMNWWSKEDFDQFNSRTGKLVNQYSAYQPMDSVFVNGQFTLGENIGDLGGINVAYDGLQRHLQENGHPGLIDGFTPEQRFFISWATIWRTKYRPEFLRTQVLTDPHSPAMYRANGPLVNLQAFYDAFDIKQGDPMWRPESERVNIW